ncbi:helix-turn-helix transcriptional regulator [Fructobacillus sp. M2-14]|uniref:Helix-turn-helix transcriptional regulator n=1 Tax=Fructobacillus broussonetiae TaxID=2713173 RepID=A0ABS5QZT2_9LACO|nr:helix-turn-helix transcriptional regulator [Fructobacillus broussonetiae]MBS9338691.1 helix-turn-helix transcriptional regulator [Fructobacillus broussonetiae]
MQFSEHLKKARQDKGLTQEQLAQEFHTSRQNISSWENAKTYPNMQDLIRLSDFFGISLDVFLKEDGKVQESLEAAPVKKLLVKLSKRLTYAFLLLLIRDVTSTISAFTNGYASGVTDFVNGVMGIAIFLLVCDSYNIIQDFNDEFGIKVVYPWQRFLNREENREN